MVKYERNRLAQVGQTFLPRLALTVRPWHFGAVRDKPWAVLPDDCRELVAHAYILPLAVAPSELR